MNKHRDDKALQTSAIAKAKLLIAQMKPAVGLQFSEINTGEGENEDAYMNVNIYIYLYVSVCICVCICVCINVSMIEAVFYIESM